MAERIDYHGIDNFYEEPWDELVARHKALGEEIAPKGRRYTPDEMTRLMAGVVLHPFIDGGKA